MLVPSIPLGVTTSTTPVAAPEGVGAGEAAERGRASIRSKHEYHSTVTGAAAPGRADVAGRCGLHEARVGVGAVRT